MDWDKPLEVRVEQRTNKWTDCVLVAEINGVYIVKSKERIHRCNQPFNFLVKSCRKDGVALQELYGERFSCSYYSFDVRNKDEVK